MYIKKKKFKPVITRVKLNPEQAVLTCACYNLSRGAWGGWAYETPTTACVPFTKDIVTKKWDAWETIS